MKYLVPTKLFPFIMNYCVYSQAKYIYIYIRLHFYSVYLPESIPPWLIQVDPIKRHSQKIIPSNTYNDLMQKNVQPSYPFSNKQVLIHCSDCALILLQIWKVPNTLSKKK